MMNSMAARVCASQRPPASPILPFTLLTMIPRLLEYLRDLALKLKQDLPDDNALHHHFQIDGGSLRFERHGEFYRIAIIAEGAQPQGTRAADLLPPDWLDGLPGKRLVAIHTHLLASEEKTPTDQTLLKLFGHDDLAASIVAEGKAIAWTDFRIHSDGFSRWLGARQGSHTLAPWPRHSPYPRDRDLPHDVASRLAAGARRRRRNCAR